MDNVREKLVELLRNGKKEHVRFSRIGNPITSIFEPMVDNKMVETLADYLIANGVMVQEWFPVTEPPKEDGRYNVYIAYKAHACVDAVRFYKNGVGSLHKNVWARYDCEDGYYEVKNITHWMPLPQPPKGE